VTHTFSKGLSYIDVTMPTWQGQASYPSGCGDGGALLRTAALDAAAVVPKSRDWR